MLIFPMLLCHLKFETLKLKKLHFKVLLFVLVPSELDISNADICHITLSTQIWNLETVKPSLQVFAVCLCPLNLTFRVLTFRVLTFPMLLCHQAFLLSRTKCAVLKHEMCRFQTRKMWQFQIRKMCQLQIPKLCQFQIRKICQLQIRKSVPFKYENPAFSKKKNVSFSNTKNASFSSTKNVSFQIRKYIHFKYENLSFSNTRMCHFQIRKTYCGLYVFSNTNVTYFRNKLHAIDNNN